MCKLELLRGERWAKQKKERGAGRGRERERDREEGEREREERGREVFFLSPDFFSCCTFTSCCRQAFSPFLSTKKPVAPQKMSAPALRVAAPAVAPRLASLMVRSSFGRDQGVSSPRDEKPTVEKFSAHLGNENSTRGKGLRQQREENSFSRHSPRDLSTQYRPSRRPRPSRPLSTMSLRNSSSRSL